MRPAWSSDPYGASTSDPLCAHSLGACQVPTIRGETAPLEEGCQAATVLVPSTRRGATRNGVKHHASDSVDQDGHRLQGGVSGHGHARTTSGQPQIVASGVTTTREPPRKGGERRSNA